MLNHVNIIILLYLIIIGYIIIILNNNYLIIIIHHNPDSICNSNPQGKREKGGEKKEVNIFKQNKKRKLSLVCLQFKADLITFCNKSCHYLLPPYSQARFPQTWPRSKLASSYEPTIIGRDVASLMHFTFFATCLTVTWRFRKFRISAEFITSKSATRFRANSFLRTSDPELITAENQYERVNIYS